MVLSVRKDFPIIGEFNNSRSQRYNNQDTINMYVDQDLESLRPLSLSPLPGTEEYVTISQAEGKTCRVNGVYSYKTDTYAVMGELVFKINESKTISQLSPTKLSTTNGAISWANNTSQIALVDGVGLFIYEIQANNFIQVTLPTGMPANPFVVYYQDARLFIRFRDDPRVYYSAQGDFSKLDAGNFEVQQSRPSVATGLIGANERLFLLGDVSAEVWAPPQYANNNPIIRDNNLLYEFGCGASASVVKGILNAGRGKTLTSFVAWFSSNQNGVGTFVMSTGGPAIIIGSDAIEREIEQFDKSDDCFGFVVEISGVTLIEWTFPDADKTFVYNIMTKTWSRKVRNDGKSSNLTGHTFVNERHIVGNKDNNMLYEMKAGLMTDNGEPVNRSRTTLTFYDKGGNQLSVGELIVYFETGDVISGSSPVAYLEVSFDSGKTWTQPSPSPMGEIGEFARESRWHNLGVADSYTFRISIYEPVRVFIMGASIDYVMESS